MDSINDRNTLMYCSLNKLKNVRPTFLMRILNRLELVLFHMRATEMFYFIIIISKRYLVFYLLNPIIRNI